MQDQGRHVEFLQVLGRVSLRKGLDAEVGPREAAHHVCRQNDSRTPSDTLAPGPLQPKNGIVRSLKNCERSARAQSMKHLDRQAAWIARRFEHRWRNRADQHRFRHALGAVASDEARNLAATGGMADVDRVMQVELLGQFREIVRIGVEVVSILGLVRAAMTAAIMGDGSVAARGKQVHLVLSQWPTVAEYDGLSLRAVFRGDRCHGSASCLASATVPRAWRGSCTFVQPAGCMCCDRYESRERSPSRCNPAAISFSVTTSDTGSA